MLDTIFVMSQIEKFRNTKKLTIEELTKDIVSRRNYSRYLSGEIKVSFEVLSLLLNKLEISFSDFSYFIVNTIITENIEESEFLYLIVEKQFDEAFDKYYERFKKYEFKTYFSNKTMPCSVIYLEYVKGLISKSDAYYKMNKIIMIEELLNKYIYMDDDIESLYIYSKLCNLQELNLIKDYLIDIVFNNKHKSFAVTPERQMLLIYLILLEIFVYKLPLNEENRLRLDQIISKALEYYRRAKIELFDLLIFEILYDYQIKTNQNNERIIFYYISNLIIYKTHPYTKSSIFKIRKEDFEIYKQVIKEESILKEEMYEGLINYDYI